MGMMPWADDTRCLYCDSKLPLYRKLTQGQFCSKAHQAAYWEEQERLAIERLHQTHDAIHAYRPPESIESILGPPVQVPGFEEPNELEALLNPSFTPASAPGDQDSVPAVAGLLEQAVRPLFAELPDLVAADPFEYEMVCRPQIPTRQPSVIEMRPLRPAAAVHDWDKFPGRDAEALWGPVPPDLEMRIAAVERPEHPATFSFSVPAAGRVPVPAELRAAGPAGQPYGEVQPVESVLEPVRHVLLAVAPRSEVLEGLVFDQLRLVETLRRLAPPAAQGATHGLYRAVRVKRVLFKTSASMPVLVVPAGKIFADWVPAVCGLRRLSAGAGLAGAFRLRVPEAEPIETNPAGAAPVVPPQAAVEVPAVLLQPATAGLRALALRTAVPFSTTRPVIPAPEAEPHPAEVARPQSVAAPLDFSLRTRAESLQPLSYRLQMQPADSPLNLRSLNAAVSDELPYEPVLPHSRLEPLMDKPVADLFRRGRRRFPLVHPSALVQPAVDFWHHAPRDLKMLLFAIPVLIALVFHPALPKVSVSVPDAAPAIPGQFKQVLNTQFANLKQSVLNRAAIALDEDFRQGLDEWTSRGGATAQWSFDATGFVEPGPLALYKPSMGLTDYQMQFLGMIDERALSWVVRAVDFQNYYVVRLVVARPGPVPQIVLQRYAVIDGVAQDRVDTRVPISAREHMQYRVRLDAHGDDLSVAVQGQMVDTWKEPRLKRGGIGFFTLRGEQSRVRWVQLTHQYDVLGRLCAYLAPYDISTTTGSW